MDHAVRLYNAVEGSDHAIVNAENIIYLFDNVERIQGISYEQGGKRARGDKMSSDVKKRGTLMNIGAGEGSQGTKENKWGSRLEFEGSLEEQRRS
jgi:hypothetical protein